MNRQKIILQDILAELEDPDHKRTIINCCTNPYHNMRAAYKNLIDLLDGKFFNYKGFKDEKILLFFSAMLMFFEEFELSKGLYHMHGVCKNKNYSYSAYVNGLNVLIRIEVAKLKEILDSELDRREEEDNKGEMIIDKGEIVIDLTNRKIDTIVIKIK